MLDLKNYPLIKKIDATQEFDLSTNELEQLAQEIRAFLVKELSNNGGHLAPNLGVVELTLALFQQFNSPTDKFFWDIGHQAYVHKILTGRAAAFDTLRQYQGLSGFLKRSESEHDIWEAGHASTSLSGAAGLSMQRQLLGDSYHIVSIIGDGALTGGMALEALNHIGDLGVPHIIVLNDNNMSISANVGALSKHINDLRMNPKYSGIKKSTKALLSKNKFGKVIERGLFKAKEMTKRILIKNPDNTFFENMGIHYYGPIDGHDFEQLAYALAYAKLCQFPILLHVITTKGKGYLPAEKDDKGNWHGIGPYSLETGHKIRKTNRNLRQWSSVVSETLERLAQQDETLVAITPAMLKGSKLTFLAEKFPQRVYDVGIAEEHAATFAAGMALNQQIKPFLAIYSTFLQRAYDQILHDIARQNLHVVIGVDRCGFAGGDGETHHGIYDIALLQTIPNMTIMMGKDNQETQQLLYNALYNYQGAIAIRYPRGYTELEYVSSFKSIPYGTWEYLVQDQKQNIVIISFGVQLQTAEAVRQALPDSGISIVNARFIKPMDMKMLETIFRDYKYIITIEEGVRQGGFGMAVADYAMISGMEHSQLYNFAIPDTYIEQGNATMLQKEARIDVDSIVKTIKEELS